MPTWMMAGSAAANLGLRDYGFRDKLREQDCRRLDVWIGRDWIRGARLIAQWHKIPLWVVVEDTLKAYVAQHTRINGPVKDCDRSHSFWKKDWAGWLVR